MSLSQAIQSVRRNGNVERIISAETKVSGGRETHHIKVLTKDGKVKTHRVPGRTRN
jgi:DNA-binding transcriptional ArsR family regulator